MNGRSGETIINQVQLQTGVRVHQAKRSVVGHIDRVRRSESRQHILQAEPTSQRNLGPRGRDPQEQ